MQKNNGLNSKETLADKVGGAIEKVGEAISKAGAQKVGQAIYNAGDKIEKNHKNPNHPKKYSPLDIQG